MGTVAARPVTRSRSVIVFGALIALVVSVALGVGLQGPRSAPAADGEGQPMPLMEQPAAARTTDWPIDADEAKAAGLAVEMPPGESVLVPARYDQVADDALIVRTGSLELEVEDVASSLAAARREMADLGGYVAGSDEYDQGERHWATVTYRVPVDRFGEAIAVLRGLSERVVHESTQSAEVTATVVDLDARISNLRASEAALVEIMDRAGRIDDVLSVQLRLEEVRGRIEQLEAQRANLADQAALSTLTVSWSNPVAAVSVVQQGWDVGSEVDRALAQTVEALQGLASLLIWLAVVVLPLAILPLLALLGLAVLLRRRSGSAAPATE